SGFSGVAPSGLRQPGGLKKPISSSEARAPRPGFEPGTYRLTAGRSTVELSRKGALARLKCTKGPLGETTLATRGSKRLSAGCTTAVENGKTSASMELRAPTVGRDITAWPWKRATSIRAQTAVMANWLGCASP